jgi:HEAT repeat protein
MFSFKDLRAITLLDRLKKTSDTREEEFLLGALHDAPSQLSVTGLLERAKSPRLSTRLESLRALEALDTLSGEAEKALMEDLINNPYTTAYISARILGNHGYAPAIPVLRELAASDDYMLAGEAMIALAKLRDEAFRPEIERIITNTRNPRLKIMGVEAFGIYGSPNSLSVLLDILKVCDPPPYLRDEVILAMAGILEIQNLFYPLLIRYLEDNSAAATLAQDEAEASYEFYVSHQKGWGKRKKSGLSGKQAKALQGAVSAYMLESNGVPLSRWIMELPLKKEHTIIQVIMSEAVLDDDLSAHDRLKLLIAHWASHELRILAKEKESYSQTF